MPIVKEIPAKAVVDSGPLFNVLALNYVREMHRPELKRGHILRKALNDSDPEVESALHEDPSFQDAYLRFFTRIRTYLTTSHVIGEIQGLQNGRLRLHGQDLRSFWLHSMDFLRAKNLEERLIRLLDLHAKPDSSHGVCELGPTDAGLIELSQSEGCILPTHDKNTLARHAWEVGARCELVRNVVGYYK